METFTNKNVAKTSVSDPYSVDSGSSQKISIRIQKTLNPDPSYFLTQSENNIQLFHNYTTLSSNDSIERYNVVKSKIILC